jgi:threonine dehydrogenase-like Zn-dependent dehydrogenase
MASVQRSKAIVLTESNTPLQTWERDVPPPADGCINIKVLRAGVCGTDPHLWKGDQTLDGPVVLGHEGLGQIIELGKGVATDHASSPIAVGDIVYWNPIRPCNACYDCTVTQDFTACTNGTFWSPANQSQVWASYTEVATLLPNNSFYRVDQRVPLDAYIALGCALPTMLQAVDALGGISRGCTVVVQGAGPVGLAAIMLSKLAGAEHIVCIEGNKARLQQAIGFGVTIPIDMRSPEFASMELRRGSISRVVGERGVNLVIECSGNAAAFEEGINLLARSGKYLLVGTWAGSSKVAVSPFQVVQNALTIIGSTYASPGHYYRAIKVVQANHRHFPLVECVTHRYELAEAQRALEDVAAGKVTKAVIFPQGIDK